MAFKHKLDGTMNLSVLVFKGQVVGFRRKQVVFKHGY